MAQNFNNNQQNGYPQNDYPQNGYQQGGYQQNGYQQGGYQQNGYQQGGYQQSGYQQSGYQQNGYQQNGAYANYSQQTEYRHPKADYLYGQQVYQTGYVKSEGLTAHMTKIFGLMVGGLIISTIIAVIVQMNLLALFMSGMGTVLVVGSIILQLVLVLVIGATIRKGTHAGTATALFLLYSAVTGVTLAVITFGFSFGSIIHAFAVCSLFFAALCIVGHLTDYKMLKYGRMLIFALLFFVVIQLISAIFFPFNGMTMLFDLVGIILFAFYTVYDFQAIKYQYSVAQSQGEVKTLVVTGALSLYLDFINLFIRLLSIFGNRD